MGLAWVGCQLAGPWVRGQRWAALPGSRVSAVIQHQGTGPGGHQEAGDGGPAVEGLLTGAQTWATAQLHRDPRGAAAATSDGPSPCFRCGLPACAAPLEGRGEGPPEWRGPGGGEHDPALPAHPASSPPHQTLVFSIPCLRAAWSQAHGMRAPGPQLVPPASFLHTLSPGAPRLPAEPQRAPPWPACPAHTPGTRPLPRTPRAVPETRGLSPAAPGRALPSALLCCGRLENVPSS